MSFFNLSGKELQRWKLEQEIDGKQMEAAQILKDWLQELQELQDNGEIEKAEELKDSMKNALGDLDREIEALHAQIKELYSVKTADELRAELNEELRKLGVKI